MLPYASISIGGEDVAVSGTPVTETRRFPLALGNDETGEIVIGLRPGDLTLSAGDEQALGIVAPLVAQTLRARQLSRDLQESRTAAIKAIEEERRRLRRDLHDGLGPTLSGIAFTADAARNTITSDPAAADALLLRLRADAVAAVGEIRRLVYDMRPPSLDELGLVAALRQQVSSIRTADGRPMHVQVEANDLPPLPAAVEVAAFRIATEAVLNSARHSGTDRAFVHIQHQDDTLDVSVRDPGPGASAWQPGVGLSSMRERAAEVGGTLDVTTGPEGSHVRALLPAAALTA
jgi:signal transduction histidine kinase